MAVDLTLNRFMVPNLPDFNNAFGVKKAETGRGCSTEELVANMMLPFLRSRPVDITGNTTTSTAEANAVLNLAGNITTLTLGPGAYTSVELLIMNNAQNKVKLLDGLKKITLEQGDVLSVFWTGSGWWQNPKDYPVGKIYIQYPNDPEPGERWLPGNWELWNSRAEQYGLSLSLPAPESMPDYDENENIAIPADSYRLVTHADGDKDIYQAIEAIPLNGENKIGPFVDVKWRSLSKVSTVSYRPIYVWRRRVQTSWSSADLNIGDTVSYNGETYYISARHNLGGKFLSFAGGNRPPYESGGVHGDVMRPLRGSCDIQSAGYNSPADFSNGTGMLWLGHGKGEINFIQIGWGGGLLSSKIEIDASRVVPTGPENSVRTLSVIYWRRVPDPI